MITNLKPNEYFVFGSNANGIHAGGAALMAVEFGALYGASKGLTGGQTYGIETLDHNMKRVPLDYIREQLKELNTLALRNPYHVFLLTPIGTGIAGFDFEDIENLVDECINTDNIIKTWTIEDEVKS